MNYLFDLSVSILDLDHRLLNLFDYLFEDWFFNEDRKSRYLDLNPFLDNFLNNARLFISLTFQVLFQLCDPQLCLFHIAPHGPFKNDHKVQLPLQLGRLPIYDLHYFASFLSVVFVELDGRLLELPELAYFRVEQLDELGLFVSDVLEAGPALGGQAYIVREG